jgi:hypothetical protein
MALLSTVWKITRFLSENPPVFTKTHKFAQNNYFLMTSDVLDRKLNKENQICNFSSFLNEKGILNEIWYSMNFSVKNVEISFPKLNRHEYYTAVSYIIRLGNVRTFKIIWSSKENMVQFFRNQGQRSKIIFHRKIH